MNTRIRFIVLLMLLLPFPGKAQELSYSHYNVKDGLAGSTVYCISQDKEGFLWFGTETGLSRFDGTHFKTFTVAQGLPDNEVIELFSDSKGRVWIAPFKKTVCYYYKGKIYNAENDPQLKKLRCKSAVIGFAEDAAGNILMREDRMLHMITIRGETLNIDSVDSISANDFVAIGKSPAGHFWIQESSRVFELKNGHFNFVKKIDFPFSHDKKSIFAGNLLLHKLEFKPPYRDLQYMLVENLSGDTSTTLVYPQILNKFSFINDSLFSANTRSGALVYNTKNKSYKRILLSNKSISSAVADSEGGVWFATLGEGIYRLNSDIVINVTIAGKTNDKLPVYSIIQNNGNIVFGTALNYICRLVVKDEQIAVEKHNLFKLESTSEVLALYNLSNDSILCGTSNTLVPVGKDLERLHKANNWRPITIKSIAAKNASEVVIATNRHTLLYNAFNLAVLDTIWRERATIAYYRNDTFFIGALDGLYMVLKDKSVKYWGNTIPSFKNRISAIKESEDGTLWIATVGDGVLGYRNGAIIARWGTSEGLSSNNCRTLFTTGHHLWVGTDKGLNKIDISHAGSAVTKYTTSDGLMSDIINAVYVKSDTVYIGTSEGLSFFDDRLMAFNSKCILRVTDIVVAGRNYPADTNNLSIAHNDNNLRVGFAGISFRSAGDMSYRYRLTGLDTSWKSTTASFLDYPTLPSGDYELQLQAINKFGITSNMVSIRFSIEKMVWEKNWVRILFIILLLAVVWLLVSQRIRKIRRREEEKADVTKRISELEQLALRSQINPHFIFNSLNSIQQYVMDKDIGGANKFITDFSRLIRQTLNFSSKPFISINDEMDYMSTYLELERIRFEDKFRYSIAIDDNIDADDYHIPPLILQPYVENSIRHGIRYRKDKEGVIKITVTLQNNRLVCIIEDNGIGRKQALLLKSSNPIEYQSKGMSLTASRVEMFNKSSAQPIDVVIDDMEDEHGEATGTKITVSFPV